ncbi:SDR family NAD(P)-dependent oxidoreductase [Microbulbifer sp. 2205BS26-8]|uniref:SDR family NAD(P)-dependent oxidoreductase n=1 Tax=Microbulbifer sp. 2205BS26-8 TaxID=3064386 RepID=UPI00353179BE
MREHSSVAIVGIDCRYAGIHNKNDFLDTVLNLRQQFRRIPEQRLNLDDYYNTDTGARDHTYSTQAAVLNQYTFDRLSYRIAESTFRQTDMTHWLALDVTNGALEDAGFPNGIGLNKERIGVVVGNSLAGEFTRANNMRLRWPYVARVVSQIWEQQDFGLSIEAKHHFMHDLEMLYKSPFPEPDADSLAGGLANTIAGRICNYFDFNGGGFTVDGACSSSLLAVTQACDALQTGGFDAVLVGGVDLSIDPFEIIGFSRTGALAPEQMRIFDQYSQGFWPGEGCGMILVMTEEKARRFGCNIYATIQGWGVSSDGGGAIIRPKAETQALALNRAYEKSPYNAGTVSYFEGHGTGTAVGDEAELRAVLSLLRKTDRNEAVYIGSVKHLIGHTKGAAGIAGVIKAALVLKHRILPPGIPTDTLHPLLKENALLLKRSDRLLAYEGLNPYRAGVSSMGFGGINTHLTLEAGDSDSDSAQGLAFLSHQGLLGDNPNIDYTWQDANIFPVAEANQDKLLGQLEKLKNFAWQASNAELTDLSSYLCGRPEIADKKCMYRAALVIDNGAKNGIALNKKILDLIKKIDSGVDSYFDLEQGIAYSGSGAEARIGLLFPGQGAPVYPDSGAYKRYLDNEEAFTSINKRGAYGSAVDTAIAQPAVVSGSLNALQILEKFDIQAELAIGHSVGELVALCWSGCLSIKDTVSLATKRGALMSSGGEAGGAMLALHAPSEMALNLAQKFDVEVACYNGPDDTVLAGAVDKLEALQQCITSDHFCTLLPISHGFHSKMMKSVNKPFADYLSELNFQEPTRRVISTISGRNITEASAWRSLLVKQVCDPVQFYQAITLAHSEIDLFVEVGPGNSLTSTLKNYSAKPVIAMDIGGNSTFPLLSLLALKFVSGNSDTAELDHLILKKNVMDWNWSFDFLTSPCEMITDDESFKTWLRECAAKSVEATSKQSSIREQFVAGDDVSNGDNPAAILAYTKELIGDRLEIPVASIQNDDKILSDLHINSLTVAEVVSKIVKHFGKEHKAYSTAALLANTDSRLSELAQLIADSAGDARAVDSIAEVDLEALPNWVHCFEAVKKQLPPMDLVSRREAINDWTYCGAILPQWRQALDKHGRDPAVQVGKLVFYGLSEDSIIDDAMLGELVELAKRELHCVVVIQAGDAPNMAPLWRTWHLENSRIPVCYLRFPDADTRWIDRSLVEASLCVGWHEIEYDSDSRRLQVQWQRIQLDRRAASSLLTSEDRLLVTGGSSGLGYVSACHLAKTTGASIVLLGRRNLSQDAELSKRIQQLSQEGIRASYVSVDVGDAQALAAAIDLIQKEGGQISAVLHAAGINQPKVLGELRQQDFKTTAGPKVAGLANLLEQLPALKLLVGYGSIIAESGMHGNADYAQANEEMAELIETYGASHPDTRCHVLEWSVWSEIGMGSADGMQRQLSAIGVSSIPVETGLEALDALLRHQTPISLRTLVCGRYAGLDTLKFTASRLPSHRFLQHVQHYHAGVELVADSELSFEQDPYLKDHVYRGQCVLPTVIALEAMAQVAGALVPGAKIHTIQDLNIRKPVLIPKQGTGRIRVSAVRVSDNQLWSSVQTAENRFNIHCYEARLLLSPQAQQELPPFQACGENLDINPVADVYEPLLFHTGQFRCIDSFQKITHLGVQGKIARQQELTWGGQYSLDLVLGDIGINDAVIHAHQAAIPHESILPSSVESISYIAESNETPYHIETQQVRRWKDGFLVNAQLRDAHGQLLQYWQGLTLTPVSGAQIHQTLHKDLLPAYIGHRLGETLNRYSAVDTISVVADKEHELVLTVNSNPLNCRVRVANIDSQVTQEQLKDWFEASDDSGAKAWSVIKRFWPELKNLKLVSANRGWALVGAHGEQYWISLIPLNSRDKYLVLSGMCEEEELEYAYCENQ